MKSLPDGELSATVRHAPPIDHPKDVHWYPWWLDRAIAWLTAAFIVIVFGLPLFRGLDNTEFGWDEPIYAFAVDKILETRDWLTPRSIPYESAPFLEKPPLKFWLVAAAIDSGLVPHTEGGQRTLDAAFGVVIFLYVFGIGRMAGGTICGLVAVFVLFVHRPLIFDHGLRSNSMETALVLSYCAGMFHALAWARATKPWQRWTHPLLTAAWFLLGFMTKFVAAIFLPGVLVLAALLIPAWRRRLLADWRPWGAACLLVIAASAPWFVYQTLEHGRGFWNVMLGVHVLQRFTTFLDPAHLKPWHYYATAIYHELLVSQTLWLVAAGTVVLLYRSIRHRWDLGIVLVLWCVAPLVAISFGTSKLYHYTYPFLPPLAIAAGLLPAAVLGRDAVFKPWLDRLLDRLAALPPAQWIRRQPPAVRALVIALAAAAFVISVATPFVGTVRIEPGGVLLFRNSSTMRPALVAAILLTAAGLGRLVSGVLLIPLLILAMPLQPYGAILEDLSKRDAPVRDMRECLRGIQSAGAPAGVYAHTSASTRWEYWYYFEDLGYREAPGVEDQVLTAHLLDPVEGRPVLLRQDEYTAYRSRLAETAAGEETAARINALPRYEFPDKQLLLLAGDFGVCADIVRADARRN